MHAKKPTMHGGAASGQADGRLSLLSSFTVINTLLYSFLFEDTADWGITEPPIVGYIADMLYSSGKWVLLLSILLSLYVLYKSVFQPNAPTLVVRPLQISFIGVSSLVVYEMLWTTVIFIGPPFYDPVVNKQEVVPDEHRIPLLLTELVPYLLTMTYLIVYIVRNETAKSEAVTTTKVSSSQTRARRR